VACKHSEHGGCKTARQLWANGRRVMQANSDLPTHSYDAVCTLLCALSLFVCACRVLITLCLALAALAATCCTSTRMESSRIMRQVRYAHSDEPHSGELAAASLPSHADTHSAAGSNASVHAGALTQQSSLAYWLGAAATITMDASPSLALLLSLWYMSFLCFSLSHELHLLCCDSAWFCCFYLPVCVVAPPLLLGSLLMFLSPFPSFTWLFPFSRLLSSPLSFFQCVYFFLLLLFFSVQVFTNGGSLTPALMDR
jgi:hypothetical protein